MTIKYRKSIRSDSFQTGQIKLKTFEQTIGVDKIHIAEHAVILLETPVTTTVICDGIKQKQRIWRPGDVSLLPAGIELESAYVSSEYNVSIIQVPVEIFKSAIDEDVSADFLERRYDRIPWMEKLGTVRALKNIIATPSAPEILAEYAAITVAASIIYALSNRENSEVKTVGSGDHRILRAIDYINSHLADPITLTEIAAVAAISPFHFSRAFKASMGMPPVRYLWERRVEMAKKMLAATDTSIAWIAHSCGFSSQSHMSQAFKMIVGMSPTAFRAKNR